MMDREQLSLAIGRADVAMQMGFSAAAAYFQSGPAAVGMPQCLRIDQDVDAPIAIDDRTFTEVYGDARSTLTLASGKLIVFGNLAGTIIANGHSEIVVAGNIEAEANVALDGIARLFVGNDFAGSLTSNGSCEAWIEGNLSGSITTGTPATMLRVGGDCRGRIRPRNAGALLYLQVEGFMPSESLESIGSLDYTEFNASIGYSDQPAGYYPDERHVKKIGGGNSYRRWVIQCERR